MDKKSNPADIAKFFFELGTLKRTERAGWSVTGISKPEVIAAHAYRATVIGYILAELEKCDKDRRLAQDSIQLHRQG